MRAVILLALVGAAFAVPRNTQRIVGGSATTIEQYPYMANLQYSWFGVIWSSACGGSLITTNSVLTAAHCVIGDSANSWRAVLGSTFANSGGSTHTLSQIFVHPQYSNSMLNNDVAVLRLLNPTALSSTINVASIAGPNYIVSDGATVTSIGWGALWSGGPASNTLQHVDINIINQQLCAERYAYLKSLPGYSGWPDITPDMICAGILDKGGKDACQGDSGGPLAHHGNILVGITSWGFGCAHEYYPGVNARVSYHTQWIVANT